MNGTIELTLKNLTSNEANSLLFVLDSLRSGKGVEVRVFEQGHAAGCEDGSCAVPETSEPVAIDTPYKPNDETVEATYEVDEAPKKRQRRAKKAPKKKQSTFTETAKAAGVSGKPATGTAEVFPTASEIVVTENSPPVAPLTNVTPAPVVAVPSVTKVDVDEALAAVFKKSGMTGARALLTQFKAERSRDLDPSQYPAFIARAKEIAG